jgi:hypothetical protein
MRPTVEYLRSRLDYSTETGELRWKPRPGNLQFNGQFAGKVAANRNPKCLKVTIDGKIYQAHRVIWAIVTGEWPTADIDHRDTDTYNNRWGNLRLATHTQNCQNRKCRSDSASGLKGVHLHKCGRYVAQIKIERKARYLGMFATAEEAYAAYCAAALIHHGEFARVA